MYNDLHLLLFWYYKIFNTLITWYYISGYTSETKQTSKEVNMVSIWQPLSSEQYHRLVTIGVIFQTNKRKQIGK